MSEKNECSCGCGCGKMKEENGPIPGETLAGRAIRIMNENKVDEERREVESRNFINECVEGEVDPMDAVELVAREEGIALSGDEPKDPGKKHIYTVLRDVVRRCVETEMEKNVSERGLCPKSMKVCFMSRPRIVPTSVRYVVFGGVPNAFGF